MKHAALVALLLSLPVAAQQKNPPGTKVDEAKVDAAIRKGVEWLKQRGDFGDPNDRGCTRELALLTLVHAGVTRRDPFFSDQLQKMLPVDPRWTYRTALRAMTLEEVDRVKYQPEIHKCAQFLVDNQRANGQWSYGDPTTFPQEVPKPPPEVATGGGGVKVYDETDAAGRRVKPQVRLRVPVKKNKNLDGGGDNSNSQYAALGLRACHDAGIILPKDVVERAQQWWRSQQHDAEPGAGAYGGAGWGYGGKARDPYGSMTAGAVGSLSICDYILGENWKLDKALQKGVAWLGANFEVDKNPKKGAAWHYYYLYGVERAGMLFETENLGKREWYPEGAEFLLGAQKADGSWGGGIIDTCFAILFLRRATRPLVESKDAGRR